MSIAQLNNYRTNQTLLDTQTPALKTVTSVPQETQARGFALYVGITEQQAQDAGTSLADIALELRRTLDKLAPGLSTQSYCAVAIAPKDTRGSNIDIVRLALKDPRAVNQISAKDQLPAVGISIDLTRKRVFLDGTNAQLTTKEFTLLRHLVIHEGTTFSRADLVELLASPEEDRANERTIDVHVRRLRAKIAGYEDIVRTVRGGGYRFEKHPDVLIES
jgi:DNA-binding response OmpR family regulator